MAQVFSFFDENAGDTSEQAADDRLEQSKAKGPPSFKEWVCASSFGVCIQDTAPSTTQWLLMTAHHIVVDERSLDILLKELGSIYMATSQGRHPDLTPCPIQYADFAHWQRQQLQTGELDGQISFWKQQLQAAPAKLELPLDMPRPAQFSGRGAMVPYKLSVEDTAALQAFARDNKASLLEAIMAAAQVSGAISDRNAQHGC